MTSNNNDDSDDLSTNDRDDAVVASAFACISPLLAEKMAQSAENEELTKDVALFTSEDEFPMSKWATLIQENQSLRLEISDLQGALKARDMEIVTLQQRCAFLTKAMEEQDASFASMYDRVSTPPVSTSLEESTTKPQPRDILNTAIDRILLRSSPTERRKSFDEDEEDNQLPITTPTTATTSAFSSPLFSSASSKSPPASLRSLERLHDDDVSKSAGFIRQLPPRRKLSGRLSVSDFGLLDDNQITDDFVTKEEQHICPTSRALFAEIDKKSSFSIRSSNNQHTSEEEDGNEREMTYAEFLDRLRSPASRDLLDTIRLFLESILGPRGDGQPPRSSSEHSYDFYGTHEFKRRCTYFFQSIDEILANHPVWRHTSEATLANARDGIEKYVMDKLSDIAMNQLEECSHWREEDERLLKRMHLLSFITPDMLEIKPCMRNEVVWSMAEDELRRINSFRSPGDKIQCIVRCCSIIFSVLNLSRGESGSRPGADDFLPLFIYIVLHSKIPRLYSNCEYIAAYRNATDLISKAGYCFVNLQSAIEFISVVDESMLKISESEFNRLYQARVEQQ